MSKVKTEVQEPSTEELVEMKVSNIVTLENGEKANFGANGKVIASYDVASRTLTFRVVTGQVITYTLTDEEQANLTDNQIEHILYARQEKVKSTLPPVKAVITDEEREAGKLDVAAKIEQELKALAEGKFVTRAASGALVELDPWMKAWAIVNAYGAVFLAGKIEDGNTNRFPVPFVEWDNSSSLLSTDLKSNWKNVEDVEVIADVLATWKALSREAKAEQKRSNTFVSTQATQLTLGIVTI
jgi:hypothetical protein